MTATVAVTGATGFIGKHIVKSLLSRGFSVRALTRTPYKSVSDNMTWVTGALEDKNSLTELVKGAEHVVHCAGQVRGKSEKAFIDCNVNGSLRLMQAALESGHCKRFLFISSLAARYPELSWYANSKHIAEQKLTKVSSGISLGIFRPTAVYGPGDKELKPLFTWLLRGVLPRLGPAEAQLSFLHVEDLASAVSQWLLELTPQSHTYELCDGDAEGYSWTRLQQIGASVRQGPVHVVKVPLPVLKILADISVLFNGITKNEPMLTRSKIRELTHPDWTASNKCLSDHINWFPGMKLERALREGQF